MTNDRLILLLNAVVREREKMITKGKGNASEQTRRTTLHRGFDSPLEFDGLLKDWYAVCNEASESGSELDNFMSDEYGPAWRLSPRNMTHSDRMRRKGRCQEEIESLKEREPSALAPFCEEPKRWSIGSADGKLADPRREEWVVSAILCKRRFLG
jgi:hypothetical protein